MTDERFSKEDYGDWQTPYPLALTICQFLKRKQVNPQIVIEPTCGKGSFVKAALNVFDAVEEVYCIEINSAYLDDLRVSLRTANVPRKTAVHFIHQDVFKVDFSEIKKRIKGKNILVLGNPPWVTNSDLGKSGGDNLPVKTNYKHIKGLEAITGKGNFDIAEYITRMMQQLLSGEKGHMALLLKNAVIRNIVREQRRVSGFKHIEQYNIDAEKEFGASTSAALLVAEAGQGTEICDVYDFYSSKPIMSYGWMGTHFVADSNLYQETKAIDGKSSLTWWSGLKHDCSKVLELSKDDDGYYNKLNERVDVEEGIVYPFLKSADLKGEHVDRCRKYIILTQHRTSEDTSRIKVAYPKAYKYLTDHERFFSERKSSIYKNRPKFCLFGIGDYTFKKYRIAISGLYKQTHFTMVSEINHKQALLDDTTYLLGFNDFEFAQITLNMLNSPIVQTFIKSISFEDAKRPINKDLLMRINFVEVLKMLGKDNLGISQDTFDRYKNYLQPTLQTTLF